MKKILTSLLFIFPLFLIAQLDYNLINVIPAPTTATLDITNDDNFIYMKSFTEVYTIDPANGDIMNQISIPNLSGANGIAYADGHFWISGSLSINQNVIRKIDAMTGETVLNINHNISEFTHGMQVVDQKLYINFFFAGKSDTIFVMDFDGNVLDKHPTDLTHSHGLTFDGEYFWLTANHIMGGTAVDANIYKLDPTTFEKIDTFDCPGLFYPNGIIAFQNSFWVAENGTDSIFQFTLDIDVATEDVEKNKIMVFPNPVQEQLEINLGESYEDVEVRIFNVQGQLLVYKKYDTSKKLLVDTPFPSGIYFVEIKSARENLGVFKIQKE